MARTLEGRELAQRYFSMIIYAVILLGALTVVSVWLTEPQPGWRGPAMLIRDCVVYGRILLLEAFRSCSRSAFKAFCGGGAAQLGWRTLYCGGCDQYGAGLCAHRGVPSGGSQGGHRYRAGGMLWAASFRCSTLPLGSVPACG